MSHLGDRRRRGPLRPSDGLLTPEGLEVESVHEGERGAARALSGDHAMVVLTSCCRASAGSTCCGASGGLEGPGPYADPGATRWTAS